MTALNIPALTTPPIPGAAMADPTRKQGGAEFGRLMAAADSREEADKPAPDQPGGGEGSARDNPIRSDSGHGERPPGVPPPSQPNDAETGPALHDILTEDEACDVFCADLPQPPPSESLSGHVDASVAYPALAPQPTVIDPAFDNEPVTPAADDVPELSSDIPAKMPRPDMRESIRNGSIPAAKPPEQPPLQPTGEVIQHRNLHRNTSMTWPETEMPTSTAALDSQSVLDPVVGFAANAPAARDVPATPDQLVATRAAALPEPHRQIADAIVRTRSGQVEIMLDPVELGRVTVLLGEDGNPGRIAVFVERPETLELIRRHSDQLLRDLRENGMPDAQLEDLRQDGSGNQRESALPPAARDRSEAQDQHAPELETQPPAKAVSLTRLDIRF